MLIKISINNRELEIALNDTYAIFLLFWYTTLACIQISLYIVFSWSSTRSHTLDFAMPRAFLSVTGTAFTPLTHSPSI